MKRIYTAANLADAHLVRDLLQHAGIAVHIFNEYAMAALGEVPMGSAYPQLWISQLHQEQHARAVIADYEQRPARQRSNIVAPAGKPIPASSSCAGIAARRWPTRNRSDEKRDATLKRTQPITSINVMRNGV